MNIYDTSRLPSWSLKPLLFTARLYNKARFGISGIFNRQNQKYKDYQNSRPLGIRPVICYAPYKHLYFGINGDIVACCFNRSHVFGKYPQQSIKETWDGKEIKELRQFLKKSDFSKGCFHCKNRIEGGNFDAVEAMLFDKIPLNKDYPTMFSFELGNECNLRCIMCSSEYSSSIERSETGDIHRISPYDDAFIEQLDEFIPHLSKAKFIGGEPFLITKYYTIWEKIILLNPDCLLLVQTNATILNDKIRDFLSRGNFRISVSLESFRKETYEKIRKNGDFDKVMSNVNYFADHAKQNNYPFGISVCPIQQNWKELPEIIDRCNKLGAWIYFNTVWIPYECSLYTLNHTELKAVIDELSVYVPPEKTLNEQRNKYHFECFLNQLKAWYKEKLRKYELKVQMAENWEKQKDEIEKLSIEEIIQTIIKHIEPALTGNTDEKSRDGKLRSYTEKLTKVADSLQSNPYIKQSLFRIREYPAQMLIQELEGNNIEELCGKAKDIIKDVTNEIENK
jgi:MoaA/NifB/PqqE/SkfB family radical SAM enzyme